METVWGSELNEDLTAKIAKNAQGRMAKRWLAKNERIATKA
jgi:hypothetical protein